MKKIAIPAWKLGEKSFGITVPYLEFFGMFGEVIPLLPDSSIREDIDLLVLPGGNDVNPLRYNQTPGYYTGNPSIYLEHFDEVVLKEYVALKKPIFGVCRGLQTLNVFFGGTLMQDISHPHSIKDRTETVHTAAGVINGINIRFAVNSMHHQAISALGNGLESTLISVYQKNSDYEPVTEAIKHNELPIEAVQWHPEEIWDEYSCNVIRKLLR